MYDCRSSCNYRPEDSGLLHTIRRLLMPTITPCLWFDGKAEAAATFYASLLPDSRIDKVHRAPSNYPSGKAGDVLTVEFTLRGGLSSAQRRAPFQVQRG